MKKKLFALLLCTALIIGMIPPEGFAAAAAQETGCDHHLQHTADCGYAEAVEGQDCAHECGWECSQKTLTCPHEANGHDDSCGYAPAAAEIAESPCMYVHDGAVCGENEETCPHTAHDESCGYQAAVPALAEVPCGHTHARECYTLVTVCSHQHEESCGYDEEKETPCTHSCDDTCQVPVIECVHETHDAACGYAEAVEGAPCGFVCTECAAEDPVCTCETETEVHEGECPLKEEGSDETDPEDSETDHVTGTGVSKPLVNLKRSLTRNSDSSAVEYDDVKRTKEVIKDDDGNMAIQIDVWTEGLVSVVPTEIVMVVDQSGSMYQAANGSKSYMNYSKFIGASGGDTTKGAQHMGYYVAVIKKDIKSDWNGEPVDWKKQYVAALVGYVDGEWKCTEFLGIEKQDWEDLKPSLMFNNYSSLVDKDNLIPLKDSVFNNKNAKIYKSLYGATIDAFYAFVEEVQDIDNTSIAIVPFSTPRGYGVEEERSDFDPNASIRDQTRGGTGVFINGEFVHVNSITDYAAALTPTDTEQGRAYIAQSLQAILTNYGGTSTEDGFLIANDIFAASPNRDNDKTNRIVVCFTDGEPTVLSKDNEIYIEYGNQEPHTAAIEAAYETKNIHNATVYVFGPSSLSAKAKNLLKYLSSDYPDATSFKNVGKPGKTGHSSTVGADTALEEAFKTLGEKIFQDSNSLNDVSEVRDTVTPYFEVGGNYNGGKIIVQKIPNTNQTDAEGNAIFNEEKPTTLYDVDKKIFDVEVEEKDVEYDQKLTDGTTEKRNGRQIIVSGYDYGLNTVFPGEGKGAKLRLLIPIEPADQFVGGQYAVTNSEDSGVYPDGTAARPVGTFKPPHVDVTVKEDEAIETDVRAKAGSTFLEHVSYSDIVPLLELQIKGIDEPLELGKPNYGQEPWKTDYVFIEVDVYDTQVDQYGNQILDEEGNPIRGKKLTDDEIIEVRRNHKLIADVYVWSRYTYDEEKNPILQEERPDGLKPATTVVDLDVYYPTFVFNDVTLYYGSTLTKITNAWGSKMDATKYLKWYTNSEYEELQNPMISADGKSHEALNVPESINKKQEEGTHAIVQPETPTVFFVVDPIDEITPKSEKTDSSVDKSFLDKFGSYMGKERIAMNVRVFFENTEDADFNPANPDSDNAMRNAFFLHMTCRDYPNCSHGECRLEKHTSGGYVPVLDENGNPVTDANGKVQYKQEPYDNYWKEEFYITPEYCEITIHKKGGIPGETYLFHVKTNSPVVAQFHPDAAEDENRMIEYFTVSITTDANGSGSVTIGELPIGQYTVTEDASWSWRQTATAKWGYYPDNLTKEEKADITLANSDGSTFTLMAESGKDNVIVSFTNTTTTDEWLNGMSAVVQNIFGEPKS